MTTGNDVNPAADYQPETECVTDPFRVEGGVIHLNGCATAEQARLQSKAISRIEDGDDDAFTPPQHFDCIGTWPNGLRGRCAPPRPVVYGDPAKSGGVVESRPEAIMPLSQVLHPALAADARLGTRVTILNTTDPDVAAEARDAWRAQTPFMWQNKWRVKSVCESNPGEWSVSLDPWPKRSVTAAQMEARRARAAKRKPRPFISEHDESVHRAIAAVDKPGRANEF